jgi:hypothetical protein
MVAGGDGSISGYIHKWGQGTPEGGTTRSVTKLIKNSRSKRCRNLSLADSNGRGKGEGVDEN